MLSIDGGEGEVLIDEFKKFFADVVLDTFAKGWIETYCIALAISFSCTGICSMVVVNKSSIITACLLDDIVRSGGLFKFLTVPRKLK